MTTQHHLWGLLPTSEGGVTLNLFSYSDWSVQQPHLYVGTKMVELREAESKMVFIRVPEGRRMGQSYSKEANVM